MCRVNPKALQKKSAPQQIASTNLLLSYWKSPLKSWICPLHMTAIFQFAMLVSTRGEQKEQINSKTVWQHVLWKSQAVSLFIPSLRVVLWFFRNNLPKRKDQMFTQFVFPLLCVFPPQFSFGHRWKRVLHPFSHNFSDSSCVHFPGHFVYGF